MDQGHRAWAPPDGGHQVPAAGARTAGNPDRPDPDGPPGHRNAGRNRRPAHWDAATRAGHCPVPGRRPGCGSQPGWPGCAADRAPAGRRDRPAAAARPAGKLATAEPAAAAWPPRRVPTWSRQRWRRRARLPAPRSRWPSRRARWRGPPRYRPQRRRGRRGRPEAPALNQLPGQRPAAAWRRRVPRRRAARPGQPAWAWNPDYPGRAGLPPWWKMLP